MGKWESRLFWTWYITSLSVAIGTVIYSVSLLF